MKNSNHEQQQGAYYSPRQRSAHKKNKDILCQFIIHLFATFSDEVKASDEPEEIKKQLLIKAMEIGSLVLNMYTKNPDRFSLSSLRKRLRATRYVITKLQKDRQRYSTDNEFRKRKIVQMQEWRSRPGNTERERTTTIKRRTASPQTVFTF